MTPTIEVTDEAKALADEHGIDLSTVKGSGAGGKIVKKDVVKLVPSDEKPTKAAAKTFYCPGCGKRSDVPGECVGGEFGHAPIAFVDAAELDGPPEGHTPAPNTD